MEGGWGGSKELGEVGETENELLCSKDTDSNISKPLVCWPQPPAGSQERRVACPLHTPLHAKDCLYLTSLPSKADMEDPIKFHQLE